MRHGGEFLSLAAAATTTKASFGRVRLTDDRADDGNGQQRLQTTQDKRATVLIHGSNSSMTKSVPA